MTCYIDEYPSLCCTVIKFQSLVFRTGNILKFNVRSGQFKQNSHIFIHVLISHFWQLHWTRIKDSIFWHDW